MSDFPRNTTNAPLTPANTNEAVIYAPGNASRGALGIVVIIANISGSPANATVRWFDGTSNWSLRTTMAVANGSFAEVDLHNLKIPASGSLKVTSSVASALTFTAIVEELTR